jgi:glycine reductase
MKIVHYLNQFFVGLGGEEAAGHPPEFREGPVGPGIRLNELLGEAGQVVGTIFAGDNYFSMNSSTSAEVVEGLLRALDADLLIAGPAFNAGRYGMACGEVCSVAIDRLGLPALMAMSENNPAVELHRAEIPILRTSDSTGGMGQALEDLAAGAFVSRI